MLLRITLVVSVLISFIALNAEELKNEKEKFSYSLGMDYGTRLQEFGEDLDINIFLEALKKSFENQKTKLTQQESQQFLQQYVQKMRKKEQDANLEAGKEFLAQNKKEEGIKSTGSGLQYEVIKEGNGKKPKPTDKVKVHYKGSLIDGTVFDSSYQRGEPVSFQLNKVIPGWTEGLQLMPVGSKYKLYIPSELAYGERGAGQQIGPNEVLIFEVELLGIEK